MGLYRMTDVAPDAVGRFSSTYDELDWAWGKKDDWGIPRARITLMTGQAGVGKTRLLAGMLIRLDKAGEKTLMSQGEVSAGQFVAEKMQGYKSPNIWISDGMTLDEQISALETVAPTLAITDSVQQIEEFEGGRGAKKIIRKIRDVINKNGTHLILISQMTGTGTTKGGTELPHEVDTEVFLTKWGGDFTGGQIFAIDFGKNRYGISGKQVICEHHNHGVEVASENRFKDKAWTKGKVPVIVPRKKILGFW